MRTRMSILILLAAGVFLGSCTQEITHYRMASTFNVDLGRKYVEVKRDASSRNEAFIILYLFLQQKAEDRYGLIGQCLHEHGGDLMTDVVVTQTSVFFIIGAYVNMEVRGTVWKAVDGATGLNSGEVHELRSIGGRHYLVSPDQSHWREVWMAQSDDTEARHNF